MFCPSCGFESTQKTNFCKRCGANINPAANVVEIHMPKPRVTGMALTIATFTLIGLIATMIGFDEFSHRPLPWEGLVVAFLGCLLLIFSVACLLVWQLASLISTYRAAIQQTIHKAQIEPIALPQAYSQPVYIPASQEAIKSSVTEHTTRQMSTGQRISGLSE
jgi:hypothetical protein